MVPLIALLPDIAARAALRDRDGAFPAEDVAALAQAGLLAAPLPEAGGFGTTPAGALPLARALRRIGRASLPLARLYEGHVNALRLVLRRGVGTLAARAARAARDGELFAVWNTEAPGAPPLRLTRDAHGLRLVGRKVLCSGAGHVPWALVTALPPGTDDPAAPRQMVLAPLTPGERADNRAWTPTGMHASVTGTVDFTGLALDDAALIGRPGDYLAQPDFSAGAWRFLAAQTGGIEALAEALRTHLRDSGRGGDPHQAARLGEVATAAETARLWVEHAAVHAEANDAGADAATLVNLARGAVERAALDVLERVQRSVGLTAFLAPHPIERLARDLATYLRQPAPDRALVAGAAAVLAAEVPIGEQLG